MFDIFGNFDSAEEINETAVNLRKEGDTESIYTLAEENGIDRDIAEIFVAGELLFLCDVCSAAIGKIEVEAKELKPVEIMQDWVDYIKSECFEDPAMAAAVRRKNKSLKAALAETLKWSFKNQNEVDADIKKIAGVNGRVTLGIPGIGRAKQLFKNYYTGK